MTEGGALLRVQEIDLALARAKATLEKFPERQKIAQAQLAYKKVAGELTKIVGQRKDVELELAELATAREDLEAKVTAAQSDEAQQNYRSARDLEKRLSDLAKALEKNAFNAAAQELTLEKLTTAEKNARELQARLTQQGNDLKAALDARAHDLLIEVRDLKREREELLVHISPELQARYIQAVKDGRGIGVEELEGNRGSACRVTLQPSVYQDVKRGPDVTTCPYCKRIMIVRHDV
jgi:hypothetical protein